MKLNTRDDLCQGRVWQGRGRSHQCGSRPSIGKYCKVHDPATKKAKQKVRDEAMRKAWKEKAARHDESLIAYGLKEATVEQLKAELRQRGEDP